MLLQKLMQTGEIQTVLSEDGPDQVHKMQMEVANKLKNRH